MGTSLCIVEDGVDVSFLRRGGYGLGFGPRSEKVDQLFIGILVSNLAHTSALQVPDMAAIAIVQSIGLSKVPRSSWVCPQVKDCTHTNSRCPKKCHNAS